MVVNGNEPVETAPITAAEPTDTIMIIEGRTHEEETEDLKMAQNAEIEDGNGTNDHAQNEHIFHSFTPLSFDSLMPKINLTIRHVHLQFNNLPDTPLFQSLLSWSDSVCHRLLLTEREFNFYSTEYNKTLLIPHRLISLHGITTSTTVSKVEESANNGRTTHSAIYCQLDVNLTETCQSNGHIDHSIVEDKDLEEDSNAALSSPDPIELILTPTELSIAGERLNVEEKNERLKKMVQNLYDSISTCISLNPLPIISNGSEGNGEGGSFEIDDSLMSALLDNSTDNIITSHNNQQSSNQIEPSNRFHPY